MPTSFSFPRSANSLVRLRMLHIRDRCFKRFGFLFLSCKNHANRVQSSLLVLLRCSWLYAKLVFFLFSAQ